MAPLGNQQVVRRNRMRLRLAPLHHFCAPGNAPIFRGERNEGMRGWIFWGARGFCPAKKRMKGKRGDGGEGEWGGGGPGFVGEAVNKLDYMLEGRKGLA